MAQAASELVIKLRAIGAKEAADQVEKTERGLRKLGKGAKGTATMMDRTAKGSDKVSYAMKNTGKNIKVTGKSVSNLTSNMRRFKMEWLSVMFFSMNASRQIQRVMMSSVSAFTKIAGKNNEAAQSVAVLGAQFKFLQYSVGSAIGTAIRPFLPLIDTIVDTLSNFIQQHPEAVFWGIVGAFAFFKTLNIAAQVALVSTGILQIAANAKAATFWVSALKYIAGAIAIGVSLYFIYSGFSDVIKGMEEGDWKKVLKGLLMAGFGGGVIGATIAIVAGGSILAGAIIGATITIGIGVIIALAYKGLKVEEGEKKKFQKEGKSILETLFPKPMLLRLTEKGFLSFFIPEKEVEESKNKINRVNQSVTNSSKDMRKKWKINTTAMQSQWENITIGEENSILSNWTTTLSKNRENTKAYVQKVNSEFNKIPRNITTTHTIRTVHVGEESEGYQMGTPYVPRTGMYMLHEGEAVIPKSQNISNSINVNVSNTSASPNDIANAIQTKLNQELRRYI